MTAEAAPSFFAPALRSRPFGHRYLTGRVVALVALSTWLAPAALGILLILPALLIPTLQDADGPLAMIAVSGSLLLFAPVYGVVLVPVGLLLGAWAMRFGLAGWAIALGTSICLPLAIGAVFQWADPTTDAHGAFLVMTPVAVVHAAIMWCTTRYLCPEALLIEVP